MTTSGTYTFASSAASGLTLVAFSRIGIRRTEITAQHLSDAASEANLLQTALAAQQPLLWRSGTTTISLIQGTSEYNLPSTLVAVQDVFLTTVSGSTSTDRMMFPISLYEYDAQPNKTTQAPPTTYLIQKILPTPKITFWQVPDGNATYTATVRHLSQSQDVSQVGGATLDMPFTYIDVYVSGLAYRLSRIYAPDKEQMRKQDYLEALDAAQKTDTQDSTSLYISPAFAGYWR